MNPIKKWLFVAGAIGILWFAIPKALFPYAKYEQWRTRGVDGVLEVPGRWREIRYRSRIHYQYQAVLEGENVAVNFSFPLPPHSRVPVIYDPAKLDAYVHRGTEYGTLSDIIVGSLDWDNEKLRTANHDEESKDSRYVVAIALVGGIGCGWSGIRQLREKRSRKRSTLPPFTSITG